MKTVDVIIGGDVLSLKGQPSVDAAGTLRVIDSSYQEVARFEPGKWSGYVLGGVEPQALPPTRPAPTTSDDIPF